MKTEEEILRKALEKYSERLQIIVAMEEMAELIAALSKHYFRGIVSINDVVDELADVEIVCKTIRMIINKDEAVERKKQEKLNRLLERIES